MQMNQVRIGVLSGSLISALLGYGALIYASRHNDVPEESDLLLLTKQLCRRSYHPTPTARHGRQAF